MPRSALREAAALIEALAAQASAQLDIYELVRGLATAAPAAVSGLSASTDATVVATASEVAVSDSSTSVLENYSETRAERELDEACSALKRWDDINADKHWLLWVRKHRAQGRWATVLKRVTELLATEKDASTSELLFQVEIVIQKLVQPSPR